MASSDLITPTEKNNNRLLIKPLLRESWQKVYGLKKTFFLAGLIYLAVNIISQLQDTYLKSSLLGIIFSIIIDLLAAGLVYLGLRAAYGMPLETKMIFKAFKSRLGFRVIATEFIVSLIIIFAIVFLPLALKLFELVVPIADPALKKILMIIAFSIGGLFGFFFLIRLSLATQIVLAQNERPFYAISNSFKYTRGNLLPLTTLFLIVVGVLIFGILTLGIGLIWAYPFFFILWGLVYKKLVGDKVSVTL